MWLIIGGLGCIGLLLVGVVGVGVAMFVFAGNQSSSELELVPYHDPVPVQPVAPAVPVQPGTVGAREAEVGTDPRYNVPILEHDPQRGAAEPLVTVVMFSDFQCPFCSRVEPTVAQVLSTYPDVRVVWKDNPLPFHRQADEAALLAHEARAQRGDEGFWAMHATLFENYRNLENADLEGYASAQRLDMSGVRRALRDRPYDASIEADQALAAQLGARGTPSFFINGMKLTGAQPFSAFQRLIDQELAHARNLVASGTPRGGIYEAIVSSGAQRAP